MYRHHPVERPSSPPPLGDPNCSYPWHPPPSSTQASPSEPSSVNGSPTPTQQQMFISSNNQTYQPFPVHHHYHTQVPPRPKLSTTLWEDEGTLCYQVDAKGICVARRQDNDMVNGTKLLNVAGMSRGKRDGILKNEKGRVVVKVGAMHLKGVWITFARAKMLAVQYKIADALYPLFVDDPSMFLYPANGGGGPSRVTAISGAFRPFGAFNASAPSPSSLPAPTGGNWDRPGDYLNRVSTSQGFRPPTYSHHDLPSSDENLYLENNPPLDYRTDDNTVGGMVSQSHASHQNYGQMYSPYQQQHSPDSPFVDQSRYAHQRETSQDMMLEQRRRDFNNVNNNFRPPQPRHVDDIPPFTSPIHMPSGKPSQFETTGGGGVYNDENHNVLDTAASSRSSSPGSRHQLQQQHHHHHPYQQQAVRLISPSAVTMSPPTPRADMPSHYFEESPTSPYLHRRESAIFDTPQRVASPRHHPYAPKSASSGKVFQQPTSIANRLDEKKTSEELVEQQMPTSLNNQNAMENHPTW
ncbi:hypothetical protein INT44_009161 [Umbelopsis vinacea]|uniref:HTH APSES-type domain-containing protein n=1 Tax=Umbelopsis vinacea TaxID=44442 RepID=A0A8H7UFT0_9FUNG|nr:hypothetical protein INT44_009161 [Umbelopsis vinacea]